MTARQDTQTSLASDASTRLGQIFGPAADKHPGLSGFSLLSHGREAFIIRLAAIDLAERTLDMQYYIWEGDTTGRIILDRVMAAADRGVRVRLLVDDPYYKSNDAIKGALDAHPNVEIRLFNPFKRRRWKFLEFFADYGRVNRRMHNKLSVADHSAAIVGGRNIADIYYGVNTTHNYRDLDVLAVGPIVHDLSKKFERYWNSPTTVPIKKIVDRVYGPDDLEAIRCRLRREIAAARHPYPSDQNMEERALLRAELLDDLVWARAKVVADDPDEVFHGNDSDNVVEFVRWRIAQLKDHLLLESPYFVLPARAQAIVKVLSDRKVRVRVLTNSLASNDMLPAHSGYAKTRRTLLKNGMEIYELRPDTEDYKQGWSFVAGRSQAALHTKAMVFDGDAAFIGSLNLDSRSAVINTEAGLYIESPEFAKKLTAYMESGVVPTNCYRVFLARDGRMFWETVQDGKTVCYGNEPQTGFRRRLAARLLKLLPIDSQL